jgi:hypothetical protein
MHITFYFLFITSPHNVDSMEIFGTNCRAVGDHELAYLVRRVSRRDVETYYSELIDALENRCRNGAEAPSRSRVLLFARLLSKTDTMPYRIAELYDIGPRARPARRQIRSTLRAVQRANAMRERELGIRTGAGPSSENSLRCLDVRLQTGRTDRRLCRSIDHNGDGLADLYQENTTSSGSTISN